MNKKQLAATSISIFLGVLSAAQPSHALDLQKLFDPILKRGICAAVGMNINECAPEQQNLSPSTYLNPNHLQDHQYPQQPLNKPNQPEASSQQPSNNLNQSETSSQQPSNNLNQLIQQRQSVV